MDSLFKPWPWEGSSAGLMWEGWRKNTGWGTLICPAVTREVIGGDPFTGHEQSQMRSTTDMHGGELWEWLDGTEKRLPFEPEGAENTGRKDKQKENKVLYMKVTVQHHCVATGNCKNQSKEENKGNKINLRLLSRCVASHWAIGARHTARCGTDDPRGALQHACSAHVHNQSGVMASWEAGPQDFCPR